MPYLFSLQHSLLYFVIDISQSLSTVYLTLSFCFLIFQEASVSYVMVVILLSHTRHIHLLGEGFTFLAACVFTMLAEVANKIGKFSNICKVSPNKYLLDLKEILNII